MTLWRHLVDSKNKCDTHLTYNTFAFSSEYISSSCDIYVSVFHDFLSISYVMSPSKSTKYTLYKKTNYIFEKAISTTYSNIFLSLIKIKKKWNHVSLL